MALSQSALSELHEVFRSGEGTDFIRECVRVAMQELIDAEATAAIFEWKAPGVEGPY